MGGQLKTEDRSLILFIAGESPASSKAAASLKCVLDENSRYGGYELTVVDVFRAPEMAEEYNIIATPTLLIVGGGGAKNRMIIGDLSNKDRVLGGLR